MRTVALLASAVLAAPVVAQDRPGSIVVRPQGSGPARTLGADPNRPGYYVVRPQLPARPTEPVLREDPRPAPQPASAQPAPTPAQPAPPAAQLQPQPQPAEEDGKLVLETWDAAYIRGQKVGHFHTVVREYEREGKKFLYAVKTQRLTIARFGEVVGLWAEDATLETPDGAVLTTRMRQGIGRDQKLSLTGTVNGRTLAVKIEGAAGGTQEIPWPDGVVGVAREATLFKDRKPKPGDQLDYPYYEGRLNRVVKILVAAKGVEEVALVPGQKPRKLLKIEQGMEPIGEFRLPPSTLWCDPDTFEPLRSESDLPMLGGRLTVLRTTKDIALRPPGQVPDVFNVQSIRLDRAVPGIHELGSVVYRVKSAESPVEKLFPTDDRQSIKPDAGGKSAELTVNAAPVGPPPANAPADPGVEFTAPSFFIDWDNDAVKRHAAQALAGLPADADPLRKAAAVEGWVHRNMKAVEFSQAMATCSNVAKTLSGDCTEYAMLSVGMLRAAGVPARTVLGLVYAPAPDGGRPYLAYHMWFEAYAAGRWVPFDATLGRGGVGPGHVKITAASWHEERSFAPLLPVLAVLSAAPQVEVVSVSRQRQ